jgi:hypothetical protein
MVLTCRACDDRGLSNSVITGSVLDMGTSMSFRTYLLGVCCQGDLAFWYYPWRVDGLETPYEMPAARWMGFRSATDDKLCKPGGNIGGQRGLSR